MPQALNAVERSMHSRSVPEASAEPIRFVFAGVAVEFVPQGNQPLPKLPEVLRECVEWDANGSPPMAHLHCALRVDRTSGRAKGLNIGWHWLEDHASIRARGAEGRLRRLGSGRFAATARYSGDGDALRGLLLGLVGAVFEVRGGFFMHATAIEIDGGAVLFLGPSGAGKSTAADLCQGRPILAVDKAAVFPDSAGRWWASPMPEHVSGRLIERRTASRRIPLKGLLRVFQAEEEMRVRPLEPIRRYFYTREAVLTGNTKGEDRRQDLVDALCRALPMAGLHTVLGQDPSAEIQRWLEGEAV